MSWKHPSLRVWGRGAEVHLLAAPRQHHEDALADHIFLHANPTDNVHISPNGSIITIVGTRPSNHGAYRCVASNAYGVAQSVVNLSVHGEGASTPGALPFCLHPRFQAQSLQASILPLSLPPSWAFSLSEPRFPHRCSSAHLAVTEKGAVAVSLPNRALYMHQQGHFSGQGPLRCLCSLRALCG